MTLSAAPTRVVYSGPSVTNAFAVMSGATPIVFSNNSHIVVRKKTAAGAVATLVEGSDYTLSGGPSAGVVTLAAGPLVADELLSISREQPLAQNLNIGTAGAFSSADLNAAFDAARQVDQELADRVGRTFVTSAFSAGPGGDIPYAPNTLLGQDAGGALTTYNPSAVGYGTIDGGNASSVYPSVTAQGWGVSGHVPVGYAFNGSTVMTDPGVGSFRLNAAAASATAIAVSAQTADSGNPNARALVASWGGSTTPSNKGTIVVTKVGAPQVFAAFTLTGALTDNTSWLQAPVAYVAGAGALTTGDPVTVQFYRTGDQGASPASPSIPTIRAWFTAGSFTWTKPAGCRAIRYRIVGGGGGSGGVAGGAGVAQSGSGAAGGYAEGWLDVTAVSTVPVTVGTGGAAGVSGNNAGGAGGSSSFGAYASATGGGGGGGMYSTNVGYVGGSVASGGIGSGGTINAAGAPGAIASNDTFGVRENLSGAPSVFGGGGRGPSISGVGTAGTAPGSGAGSAYTTTATSYAGAAGAAGAVIIEEFY